MIVVDNERVNYKNPTTPTEKWVANKIDLLKKTTKRIYFERTYGINDAGNLISRPYTFYDASSAYDNPLTGQRERWKLCADESYDDKKKIYVCKRIKSRLDVDIDVKTDPEFAFFADQIMNLGGVGYRRRDWDLEAKEFNESKRLEMHVGHIIMSELNEAGIKLRAAQYGIQQIEDKSLDLLKQQLFQAVTKEHNLGGDRSYQDFIDGSLDDSEELKFEAYVNEAFNKKMLILDNLDVKYANTNARLCIIPATRLDQYRQETARQLLSDAHKKEDFMATIEGTMDHLVEVAEDVDNINNNMKLRSIYKKRFNVEAPTGTTNEALKEALKEGELLVTT